jgi:hypothetical protein
MMMLNDDEVERAIAACDAITDAMARIAANLQYAQRKLAAMERQLTAASESRRNPDDTN